jgi:hypothetical protein
MKPSELKELAFIENPLVAKLLKEYIAITQSPVFDSWVAMITQIRVFTEELKDNPIGIRSKNPKRKKVGDEIMEELGFKEAKLEAENDEKDFAKAKDVMDKLLSWVEKANELYALLNPAEKTKADVIKTKKSMQVTI